MNLKKYPESELTEKIIGCAFRIYNELSFGLPERVYQKAMAHCLGEMKIEFAREVYGKIEFDGKIIGKYFLDFLVDNRVALEFKVRNEIYEKDVSQLLAYLKMKKIKIGLILAITSNGVKIKRLIN